MSDVKVTSKKLEKVGFDQKQYDKFVSNHVKYFIKSGMTEEEAKTHAESFCSMYKHHFRVYK